MTFVFDPVRTASASSMRKKWMTIFKKNKKIYWQLIVKRVRNNLKIYSQETPKKNLKKFRKA